MVDIRDLNNKNKVEKEGDWDRKEPGG